jgi:hypothetical protein
LHRYGTVPYFLSKTIVEMILTFLQSSLIFAIVYYIMELRGNIMSLILAGFGLSLVANSLALVLGCGISSVKVSSGACLRRLILLYACMSMYVDPESTTAKLSYATRGLAAKKCLGGTGGLPSDLCPANPFFWCLHLHPVNSGLSPLGSGEWKRFTPCATKSTLVAFVFPFVYCISCSVHLPRFSGFFVCIETSSHSWEEI